ncbi:calcium-activated chloride channel regulator 1-like [Acanthaster planci]|uniref:Calcium-activated chloride channel regulator 1-like n=1 Tax=Acanthaster planci TaxID=133434 RepID=A0A8B7XIH3_ACAPL|nr:calcium-activated chloride channel regulator 1-like [Acanthaster planci]
MRQPREAMRAEGTWRAFVLLVLACCATTHQASSLGGSSAIAIQHNGYTNVAVFIDPGVRPNDHLLNEIREMFRDASGEMYRATDRRLYFRNVTIFVPQTWPASPDYLTHVDARPEDPDVIVGPSDGNPPPLPYTRRNRGCGQEGLSIIFRDTFLLDHNTTIAYASLGKVLVYEWGQYRWGLFDEVSDDEENQFYYSSSTQQFEGIRCSLNITGTPMVVESDGVSYRPCYGNVVDGYEDSCLFIPSEAQQNATGSVMYGRGRFHNIVDFCDSDTGKLTSLHNRDAPNRQNYLCDRQSNWEVMRGHDDLKDGNNPPRELSEDDLKPTFQIVQRGPTRLVVALETSRDMQGETFQRMISATAAFIWTLPAGVSLGLVEYNDNAHALSDMVSIYTDDDRRTLLDALPKSTSGYASVGGALHKAVELIQSGDSNRAGDRILLLNGYQGTIFPSIDFVMGNILQARVIVDTVAMTQNADPKLSEVSQLTGGKFYSALSDSGAATTLTDALTKSVDRSDINNSEKQLQIWSMSFTIPVGESRTALTYIDATIGKNTKFTFSWAERAIPNITLSSPAGDVLTPSYLGFTVNATFRLAVYSLIGIAAEGPWSINIENIDPSLLITAEASLTSSPRDADVPPISVTSSISDFSKDFEKEEAPLTIYSEVRQGYGNVVNATVTALVSIPNPANPVEIQLFDTGIGADITRNDGIYSAYFTKYSGDGFYGVEVRVENNGHDAIVTDLPFSSDGGLRRQARSVQSSVPIFKRVVSTGSCRVVKAPAPDTDPFPPGKVTDLRVVASSYTDRTVRLAWTATGDDFDSGRADSYELMRGVNAESILTGSGTEIIPQSDILQGDLSDPHVSGSPEEFTVTVPVSTDIAPFAFAVVARDDANRTSPLSNIVLVALRRYIPAAPGPTTTVVPRLTTTSVATGIASPAFTESTDQVGTGTMPSNPSVTTGVDSSISMTNTTHSETGTTLSESTSVGASIPVNGTNEPILTRNQIIIICVCGGTGFLTFVILLSVSVSKFNTGSRTPVVTPESGQSIIEPLSKEMQKYDDSDVEIVDLGTQGKYTADTEV